MLDSSLVCWGLTTTTKKTKQKNTKTKLGLFPFLLLGRKETPRGLKICAVEMQREICS